MIVSKLLFQSCMLAITNPNNFLEPMGVDGLEIHMESSNFTDRLKITLYIKGKTIEILKFDY